MAFSDTLVVHSRSLVEPINPSVSGLVTRIDLAGEPEWREAGDLLARAAGFQVRRYGAVGAAAVPSLRGSTGAQVRFFLDGMPLNDAQNGVFGLDRIPLDRLEAIEIHRGVVPTGLGGIGGSGAVNFLTQTEDEGLDFLAHTGSFGELAGRVAAGLANAGGTRSGVLMVHGRRADNDFSYSDHNQTFFNAADDTVRTRENAWINQWGAWAAGSWETGHLVSRLTAGHDRRDGGRPGPLASAAGSGSGAEVPTVCELGGSSPGLEGVGSVGAAAPKVQTSRNTPTEIRPIAFIRNRPVTYQPETTRSTRASTLAIPDPGPDRGFQIEAKDGNGDD